ncbi:hypothetical protein E2L06_02175 [Haloterrigena sp. H1]|uniref:hypothetical protein n=1 Tax=Haloterrigena sp. H1 TaxID=2552943 RepID=UPI00110EF7D1|nr:hypothetical protein [Haloterrigena sp. H1]TMT85464.1 hypothetical protein E2L06_02175 [Haloterrigena sp. H1]
MIRGVLSRLREWIAVENPEERIDGSGEAIVSPQHRRSLEVERELDRLDDVTNSDRHRER